MIAVVSSGTVYVQTGGNITDCMVCLHPNNSLHLTIDCGERWGTLLLFDCRTCSIRLKKPRILLDMSSGCWTLTNAGKNDSCLYKVWYRHHLESLELTTDVRVLDPVLISNMTSNFSRLGEEMAVRVQFSGEESAVTWEVDGEPIPERYQMIDDNRTLIIPSVQRDDAERRFRVRITNPVSNVTQEYRLIDDPVFSKVLITEDYKPYGRHRGVTVAIFVAAVLIIIGIIYMIRWKCSRNRIPENGVPYTSVPQHNGSVPTVTEHNEPEAILIQNGSVPAVPENEEPEAILIQNGSVPAVPENEEPRAIPIQNGPVPAVPENNEPEAWYITGLCLLSSP